jgi:hypothetical protein
MGVLEETVRALVRDELRKLGVSTHEYRSDRELPPGISSREHFASECRRLRVGSKDGKLWSVDAAAWHEARTRGRRPALRIVSESDRERCDRYLDEAGARATARGK